jgi:pyruvoyl-dependent arginine decarboxylase (PvlArgDC)
MVKGITAHFKRQAAVSAAASHDKKSKGIIEESANGEVAARDESCTKTMIVWLKNTKTANVPVTANSSERP